MSAAPRTAPATLAPGHVVARLAQRFDGVVSRAQLRDAGLTDHVIERLVGSGHLHRRYRGVFAVGYASLSPRGEWLAAVRAVAPDGVLSHRSAAALLGLFASPGRVQDVTAPTRRRSRPGLRIHTSRLPDRSVTVHEGIPCTTVARTLVDVAGQEHRPALERAWSVAASGRLLRIADLEFEIDTGGGRPGVAAVRALLEEHSSLLEQRTRSELERLALRVIAGAALPAPACNRLLIIDAHRFEVDLLWADAKVAVELDGRDEHGHIAAFDSDRLRDVVLQAAGWRSIRVTWNDLTPRPDVILGHLRALLDHPA